jgi:lipopolysaccharide export system protein LptA
MTSRARWRWQALLVVAAMAVAVGGAAAPGQKAAAPEQKAAAPGQKNEGPPNALQGFSQNRDQPVKIQAASLEVRQKDKVALFNGDVYVVNGDTEMRCRSLVVYYEDNPSAAGGMKAADPGPGGEQQIKRIDAKGGVTVVQKDQNATGDSAIFNMRENTVTLTGNVVVTRGADILRGQRLTVDLTSGVSRMDAGRVEGLFNTKQASPPGGASPSGGPSPPGPSAPAPFSLVPTMPGTGEKK